MHITTKKRLCIGIIFLAYLISSMSSFADIYEWRDEKGDIHVVDDILLVPPEYRDKARVIKTRPQEQITDQEPLVQPAMPPQPRSEQEELYGDYPLSWWEDEFASRKNNITELEKIIEEQKIFTTEYESGRRRYRLYSKEDTEKYETYKRELPENEKKLNDLKTELEEFRHRARLYGVPRKIRD